LVKNRGDSKIRIFFAQNIWSYQEPRFKSIPYYEYKKEGVPKQYTLFLAGQRRLNGSINGTLSRKSCNNFSESCNNFFESCNNYPESCNNYFATEAPSEHKTALFMPQKPQ